MFCCGVLLRSGLSQCVEPLPEAEPPAGEEICSEEGNENEMQRKSLQVVQREHENIFSDRKLNVFELQTKPDCRHI